MVSPCYGHTCSLDKSTQKGLLCQLFKQKEKKQEEKAFEGMHSDVLANIYGNRKCQSISRFFFFLMDKPVDPTNNGNWSLMHILTKWLNQKKKKKDCKCLQFTSFSLDSLMDCRFSQRDT